MTDPTNSEYFTDADQRKLIKLEQAEIARVRGRASTSEWLGLSCSGGGIRAATFCIGAMQALAEKDLLRKFDYLSTVSGGGYAGTALQWWLHLDRTTDASKKSFPLRELDDSGAPSPVNFLRWHGNYLAPGGGLDLWAGFAVTARTIFSSLLVWLPLLTLFFFILIKLGLLAGTGVHFVPNPIPFVDAHWLKVGHIRGYDYQISFAIMVWMAYAIFAVIGAAGVVNSFAARFGSLEHGRPVRRGLAAIALVVGIGSAIGAIYFHRQITQAVATPDIAFVFGSMLFVSVLGLTTSGLLLVSNYSWRRKLEIGGGVAIYAASMLLFVGMVPVVPYFVVDRPAAAIAAFGSIATGAGTAVSLLGLSMQKGGDGGFKATIFAGLFLFAGACVAYILALALHEPTAFVAPDRTLLLTGFLWAIIFGAVVLLFFANVNYVGLHRFYRDRLMEAYMPDPKTVQGMEIASSPAAEALSIDELFKPSPNGARPIPYPLVNTSAILINDEDKRVSSRGGSNFILSPRYVGSDATGWEATERYQEKNGRVSVATAMAASGAAINANAAYEGSGITRNRLVSIAMTVLSVRLGVWAGRPSALPAKTNGRRFKHPKLLNPGLRQGIFRYGYHRDTPFIELSDGGNFENLGIYELVRRRVDVVFALDAEEDQQTTLPALVNAARRVMDDFKVKIDLDDAVFNLMPTVKSAYPLNCFESDTSYLVAPISYSEVVGAGGEKMEAKPGVLIYVKASVLKEVDAIVRGYRANNPLFPHQSTLDQFFDAQQFEAYRKLGWICVQRFLTDYKIGDDNLNAKSVLATRVKRTEPLTETAATPAAAATTDSNAETKTS